MQCRLQLRKDVQKEYRLTLLWQMPFKQVVKHRHVWIDTDIIGTYGPTLFGRSVARFIAHIIFIS